MLFVNNKNGKFYSLLHEALDCTNSRDGSKVIVYCSTEHPDLIYVRDKKEFYAKFKAVSSKKISDKTVDPYRPCKAFKCVRCRVTKVEYYEDGGRGDFHYHCRECNKYWSVDGPDS